MIFLKLGGSLITDKATAETPRPATLVRLAGEIRAALLADPSLRLLVGHGSGSFGHQVAAKYGTHRGASSEADWRGFAEVWKVANRLHRLVVDALLEADVLAVSFPPSASAVCRDGEIRSMAVEPIRLALQAGLVPVVAGDVAFDWARGSTIVSTERVFAYLARELQPTRLLLAGVEAGVYADFPSATRVLPVITEKDLSGATLGEAMATDVTGGMADKVRQALAVAHSLPAIEIRIFSGAEPGNVCRALAGEALGTSVRPMIA